MLGVRYGSGEKETLDVFPADRPNAPVQLFIHGGYWRAMDKSDYSFIADVFHSAGAVTVLVNYDLCPAVTFDTIVVQVNRAIAWTFRNVAEYGGDPHRLYVSGNSAGGHLDAMALAHDWEADEGIPADVIKGAVPVTGVFDCEPVPDVTVNEEVRLDRETARRLSPLRNPPRRVLPVLVAVGSAEPPLWIRMSKLKFRDSLTEMDSRFRGNDVISARHVTFTLTVIPAKAGIHRLIQGILNPET